MAFVYLGNVIDGTFRYGITLRQIPTPFQNPLRLTDTIDNMKNPINCVLMGNQPEQIDKDAMIKLYKRIFRE